MTLQLQMLLFKILFCLMFIGGIAFLWAHINRIKNTLWIGNLLLISLIMEVFKSYFSYNPISINYYQIFTPIRFTIMLLFFFEAFKSQQFKNMVKVMWVITLFLHIANTIWLQGLSESPDNLTIVFFIEMIVLSMFLMMERVETYRGENIFLDYVFLISSAILLFHILGFQTILLRTYFSSKGFSTNNPLEATLWISNIIYYSALMIIGIILSFRKKLFETA